MSITTRFAPSPTGRLHAGTLASALINWVYTRQHAGRILMRIEDIDATRSRSEYADQLLRDFEFLGLTWDGEVQYQSRRTEIYDEYFHEICQVSEVYPCFCTRAQRLADAGNAPHGLHVYSGRCRGLSRAERARQMEAGSIPALRLVVPDLRVTFDDIFQGSQRVNLAVTLGDSIIKRADGGYAYQFAVSVDDALMGVTHVLRGIDLLESSALQIYLTELIFQKRCTYGHIPLLATIGGQRLAKRHHSASLDELLDTYGTKEALFGHIAALYGLISEDAALSLDELVSEAEFPAALPAEMITWDR